MLFKTFRLNSCGDKAPKIIISEDFKIIETDRFSRALQNPTVRIPTAKSSSLIRIPGAYLILKP